MEIEPQIGFWKTFDEPSKDEYISWQEDFTQAADVLDATEDDPVELPDSFSSILTSQEVNLEPKRLENNPSKAPSCVVSSIPIQRRLEIPPSKDETVKKPGVAPCSPKIKYAIKNNGPQSKLVIKLVSKKPSSPAVDVSKTLCLICERTFSDQRSLNTHLTRMHAPTRNLRDNPANIPKVKNSSGSRRMGKNWNDGDQRACFWVLQCGLCKMTFLKARDLHEHTIVMHGSARIIIKTPSLPDRTTEEEAEGKARNSGHTIPTSQPQMTAFEKSLTQASSVDTVEAPELATQKIVVAERDTTERNSCTLRNDRRGSLPSSGASRIEFPLAEALPAQSSSYADGQKISASGISYSIPETPEKVPQGIASFGTTNPISSTTWQNEDGPQDLTSRSNLQTERHRGASSDRLVSRKLGLTRLSPNEVATNPARSGSNCPDTGSQREPSVCTVAPVAKEYTSPITSMPVPSCLSSPAAKLEVASVRQNRDMERRATALASTTFRTQNSPSIHPNLKRPLSDVMADCLCYPGRTGGDISSESCTQQTLRSSVFFPAPRCTAEAQNCASSLAQLVSSSQITSATASSNPRSCEACMKLCEYKSEHQIETTAKMLLGKTYELVMEINKRPLDLVKPLVNALQHLICTMDTKVFVAYMNFVLPETSRTAVANPFLKRILSQPALPNKKPQDASRSPIEQPSNNFHAGLQEASGPDNNCDGLPCWCSAKRFKGT